MDGGDVCAVEWVRLVFFGWLVVGVGCVMGRCKIRWADVCMRDGEAEM